MVRTGSSTAKACHSSRSSPVARTSSWTMVSARRRMASRSSAPSPSTRMARPRPGPAARPAGAQAGPGEGRPPDDLVGQADEGADLADLVLEEFAQRLEELEAHVLGQAPDIVMRLDRRGGALEGHRLDHVGIHCALREPGDLAGFAGPIDRKGPGRD